MTLLGHQSLRSRPDLYGSVFCFLLLFFHLATASGAMAWWFLCCGYGSGQKRHQLWEIENGDDWHAAMDLGFIHVEGKLCCFLRNQQGASSPGHTRWHFHWVSPSDTGQTQTRWQFQWVSSCHIQIPDKYVDSSIKFQVFTFRHLTRYVDSSTEFQVFTLGHLTRYGDISTQF